MGKYGAIRGKATFDMHKSLEDRLWEAIFGTSEQEKYLKGQVTGKNNRRRKEKYGKGRLGVDLSMSVQEVDEDVYAGDFIMGGRHWMKGIVDTATDLVAVFSDECTTCGTRGY